MGRRNDVKAGKNKIENLTVDGVSLKDRRFKTHVRHFYRPWRGGIALAGTIAMIYDRSDDTVYLGISPVNPCDLGCATKKHGYRAAMVRSVRASERKKDGRVDKPQGFFFHAGDIPDGNPAKDVLAKWLTMNREKMANEVKPHEDDETWLNGTNFLRIYALGLSLADHAAWTKDEEEFVLHAASKWRVLNRFNK